MKSAHPCAGAAAGGTSLWKLRSSVLVAIGEAESICTGASSGRPPSQKAIAGAVLSSAEALAGLDLHASYQQEEITELQQQVSGQQQQITQLQQQITQLQQQLQQQYYVDSGKLLLRQMATQAVNKLVRKVKPGISAYDARDVRLSVVAAYAEESQAGVTVYQKFSKKYTKLKAGVKALCEMGRPVAHPIPQPPVTEEVLRAAIKEHVPLLTRPHAEEVLTCLVELAADMGEPLFVSTEGPQQGSS
ncbi:hypothetical protein GPECTOR_19g263 [Gonium pectorale]|uniref:Uncharacterized protein n=1 Tax=Gonium pectorale TaxID=33097 RepID=A0A150GJ25_GONPE|nr:hypothetical protein GPECTOR_19g263 [Gonium pectorale]|eukprot:KXZ49812.1 hypothetical protein GPECTOR_19g263 [Gonium pectorale]